MQKQQDKLSELKNFHSEVLEYCMLSSRRLNNGSVEGTNYFSLHSKIKHKAGYLKALISELSDTKNTIIINGDQCDRWMTALQLLPINQESLCVIQLCATATGMAIGKLEDDIQTGKRDKLTGDLIVKSKTSESPPLISTSKENWQDIKNEYGDSKMTFGKKINFITDSYKRKIIFRDIEHAFLLANSGFSKSALILAGGIIEELLRSFLMHKNISIKQEQKNDKSINDDFNGYITICKNKGLLKKGIYHLSDSVRDFRNLVHLSKEQSKKYAISKATAKGAVSAIFTIANNF